MLKLKRMIRSDLFWSLTGGFAIGAVAIVSLQQPDVSYNSFAQSAPTQMIEQL